MKNRMQEICSFGSVRSGDGNVPTYSAVATVVNRLVFIFHLRDCAAIGRQNDWHDFQRPPLALVPGAGVAPPPHCRAWPHAAKVVSTPTHRERQG